MKAAFIETAWGDQDIEHPEIWEAIKRQRVWSDL